MYCKECKGVGLCWIESHNHLGKLKQFCKGCKGSSLCWVEEHNHWGKRKSICQGCITHSTFYSTFHLLFIHFTFNGFMVIAKWAIEILRCAPSNQKFKIHREGTHTILRHSQNIHDLPKADRSSTFLPFVEV